MRQVLLGDIIAAARALLEIPPSDRAAAIKTMLYLAHSADKFRKRTGRPHKQWGNGSLMAAVPKPKFHEPYLSSVNYLCALQLVLAALTEWKRGHDPSLRRYAR